MLQVNQLNGFGARRRAYSYYANAVNFDGTNDYLTRGAGLTGAADSKLWTGSFWINIPSASLSASERLMPFVPSVGGSGFETRIYLNSSDNTLRITGENSSSSAILDLAAPIATGWQHYVFSVDMADTGKRHLYQNDSDALTVNNFTNDTIDFTRADFGVGAFPDGTGKFTGDVAVVLMWPGQYIDLSVEANRRLFIHETGIPENPARAIATLGTPLIQLTNPVESWHANVGSGGGFTENGSLTEAATSPSD